ncbi:leucine zipper putative tumor suppressor 1-like [Narcine bancroftii]|uniref:leucine zipper putative tumor suppressor 1-like n=1 Tax=Narcine bancroftii TaxID=1343680 RepID=UPI003831B7D9
MGSVSSLLSSGSFHHKPCKVLETRSRKPSHLQRFIRQQDGLLRFGAGHEPVDPSSRLEQTEDFFYISIGQTNGLPAKSKHKNRASSLGPHKELPAVMDLKGPPPVLVPFSGQHDKAREKSVVRPTAFKSVSSKYDTDLDGPLGNQMTIKLELQESVPKPGSYSEKQQEARDQKHTSCSGTLSDSGRNSMSSLPTQSTGGSHGPELNGVPIIFRKNFEGSAQNVGCHGGTLTNVSDLSTSDAGHCLASRDPSSNQCNSCIHSPTSTSTLAAEGKSAGKGGEPWGLQRAPGRAIAGITPTCNKNQKHGERGPNSPEQPPDAGVKVHGDYQLQQDKKRLEDNFAHLLQECNNLKAKCKTYEREQIEHSPKLEEIKWEVCQKSGVIALLKQQLRDAQAELVHKSNEVLTFRNQLREANAKLSSREQQVDELQSSVQGKARELEVCENELQRMRNAAELLREKVSLLEHCLKQNPAGLKDNHVAASDRSSECSQWQSEQESSTTQGQVNKLKAQLEHEKKKNQALVLDFRKERLLWCAEKERVIRYQKQLQQNYLHVHRQNHNLERTIQQLSVQLEAKAPGERVEQHSDAFEEIAATVI